MQDLEPYFAWRNLYTSEEDPQSPFYEREYSEFMYTDTIYNHYIHPQWDNIGSPTLFIKILYADYEEGFAIIELLGEWNDTLYNDIMTLKRDIIEELMYAGISKFILIGENILNFHASDDCYYEEWFEEVEDADGWIAMLNFRAHVVEELIEANIDSYFVMGGQLEEIAWRTHQPRQLYSRVAQYVTLRLNP